MYMRYLKRPSYSNETSYKRYRNKLTHSVRTAKRIYYDRQLDHFKLNIKIIWQIMNEVIHKKKRTSKLPSTFVYNNNNKLY